MSDELPPLLNERRSGELGARPVGEPYAVGGIMMLFTAAMGLLNAFLASRANDAQGSNAYGPGFSLVTVFFPVALAIGMFAGSPVARVATLILMGIVAAMIGGYGYQDKPGTPTSSPHGPVPLYIGAGAMVLGWALMLTPPPKGVKSYTGAVLVFGAHLAILYGLYWR